MNKNKSSAIFIQDDNCGKGINPPTECCTCVPYCESVTTLPVSFSSGTNVAYIDLSPSSNINITSYVPTGLENCSTITIRKAGGNGSIIFNDGISSFILSSVGEMASFIFINNSLKPIAMSLNVDETREGSAVAETVRVADLNYTSADFTGGVPADEAEEYHVLVDMSTATADIEANNIPILPEFKNGIKVKLKVVQSAPQGVDLIFTGGGAGNSAPFAVSYGFADVAGDIMTLELIDGKWAVAD